MNGPERRVLYQVELFLQSFLIFVSLTLFCRDPTSTHFSSYRWNTASSTCLIKASAETESEHSVIQYSSNIKALKLAILINP